MQSRALWDSPLSHRPSQARREATVRVTLVCVQSSLPQVSFVWLLERNPRGLGDPREGPKLEGLNFWEPIDIVAILSWVWTVGLASLASKYRIKLPSLSSCREEGEGSQLSEVV